MNHSALLKKYFASSPEAYEIVFEHSRMVADKSLSIAREIGDPILDLRFIEDAAMLHDIGVSRTHAPKISCHGRAPYLSHGILGREILDGEGFHAHALVCERHIGVGITVEDIETQQLRIPKRDMTPVTLEEKIICFADLFYSKRPGSLRTEKTIDQIKSNLGKYGLKKVAIFEKWLLEFTR